MKKHILLIGCLFFISISAYLKADEYQINDGHIHIKNYVQRGPSLKKFLKIMDETNVGRAAVFGLPLQQTWEEDLSGDFEPEYYLQTDGKMYYYSFIDAILAMEYLQLTPEEQSRFEPMICGFNPKDMFVIDHIKRCLRIFPGVFTGIGEFSVYKEFVSSKIAGTTVGLYDCPSLDKIFDFAAETGMVLNLHCDINRPFPEIKANPQYFDAARELFKRHPKARVIWAHTGLGRTVIPTENHLELLEKLLSDPALPNFYFDISWDITARHVTASDESLKSWAALIEKYPDRFLFGSDSVAPKNAEHYSTCYKAYEKLWQILTPNTKEQVLKTNFNCLFDAASKDVRAYEKAQGFLPVKLDKKSVQNTIK